MFPNFHTYQSLQIDFVHYSFRLHLELFDNFVGLYLLRLPGQIDHLWQYSMKYSNRHYFGNFHFDFVHLTFVYLMQHSDCKLDFDFEPHHLHLLVVAAVVLVDLAPEFVVQAGSGDFVDLGNKLIGRLVVLGIVVEFEVDVEVGDDDDDVAEVLHKINYS